MLKVLPESKKEIKNYPSKCIEEEMLSFIVICISKIMI